MSLPTPPFPAVPAERRIAALAKAGRLVELADVPGGEAVHTGFGYGPEFWLVPRGLDPSTATIDTAAAEVRGARLITAGGKPVEDASDLRCRGVRIVRRIPRI